MTDQQIRLHFGELNAAEMRLARAIVGWHEAREAKLRAALIQAYEVLSDYFDSSGDCLSMEMACKVPDIYQEIESLIKP